MTDSRDEVLIRVEGVSKRFCRDLKRSLVYGVQDTLVDFFGLSGPDPKLRRDEFWAVNEVSFELKRGECLGLIGHNGAGKTTLLKMLNGIIKPDRGRIEMRGRVSALIALGAGFNPILTGRENIYVNGSVLGLTKREIDATIHDIIDFSEIGDFIDSPVQSYSSGMVVRLGFAVATAMKPDILLLDEVQAVGDVAFQAKCLNVIAEFKKRGIGLILVSHNMHQVTRYADHVLYLRKGQVAFNGDCELGVEQFLRDSDGSEGAVGKDGATDWSRVYGSGKVALTAARFRNAAGGEVTKIAAGDAVTLEIDYERRDRLEEPPVLDVLIRDRDGIVFRGTNLVAGQAFSDFGERGSLSIHFSAFRINVSQLEFFFCLLHSKSGEIFDWKRHLRLDVCPSPKNHGRLLLDADWRHSPRKPAPAAQSKRHADG